MKFLLSTNIDDGSSLNYTVFVTTILFIDINVINYMITL